MAKAITAAQIRYLHALARQVGMDEDDLHAQARTYSGTDSLKDLTCNDARRLIDLMRYQAGLMDNRPGMATEQQKKFIYGMARDIGFTDRAKLRAFLENKFSVSDVEFISEDKANGVIVALKNMIRRGWKADAV